VLVEGCAGRPEKNLPEEERHKDMRPRCQERRVGAGSNQERGKKYGSIGGETVKCVGTGREVQEWAAVGAVIRSPVKKKRLEIVPP